MANRLPKHCIFKSWREEYFLIVFCQDKFIVFYKKFVNKDEKESIIKASAGTDAAKGPEIAAERVMGLLEICKRC